jgi:hypothetical protein
VGIVFAVLWRVFIMSKRPESLSYSIERRRESRRFLWLTVAGGIWHFMKVGIIVLVSAMLTQKNSRLELTNEQWVCLAAVWAIGANATMRDDDSQFKGV